METKSLLGAAQLLLDEVCEKFRYRDAEIMQGIDGERCHAGDTLEKLLMFRSDAGLALCLAALFHDIDRVVTDKEGGGFKAQRNSDAYRDHKRAHAERSAAFCVSELMRAGYDPAVVARTEFLIVHHDDSGSEREQLHDVDLDALIAADSVAFFSSIAPKLYAADGAERFRDKVRFMVEKMPETARDWLGEQRLANGAFEAIKNEVIAEYYRSHSVREQAFRYCPTCREPLQRKVIDRRNLLACGKCGFVFWNNPKPVVSVVLAKKGEVLLVKRALKPLSGYWCLPGGYVDYGEHPEAAAVRESREETSLEVRIVDLVGVYLIDNDPRGVNIDIIYSGAAEFSGGSVNEESSEMRFFSPDALPDLVAYKHRQAILDWARKRTKR